MIKIPSYIIFSGLALLVGGGSWGIYKTFFAPQQPPLFKTNKPERRTINQTIKATGYIEPEDLMKIGSIIPGIIYKLHVEENDIVKKGQLLVEIDDGKGDTDVKAALAKLKTAQENLTYSQAHYERQKALFEAGHISKDSFELITRDYSNAQHDVTAQQAAYDQALLLFNHKKIRAPEDGLIVAKNSSEGETVTITSPPTEIYTIAKDIRKMEVELEIDESTVGDLKEGMSVNMIFESYPHRVFKGTISLLSHAPIKKGSAVSYKATIPLDNSHRLFRPGMSVDATILIAEKENVIAVPNNLFRLGNGTLEQIAKVVGYAYKPLDKEERIKILETDHMKIVWVVQNKAFIERPVKIGINDNSYYEVIEGLEEQDNLLTDVAEPDAMKEFFKRFFGKGLG